MSNIPMPQQIYQHFKGNIYQIITLAQHSETAEVLVIYQALYGNFKVYARPLSLFTQKVDKIKYPNASQEYRFELLKANTADFVTQEQGTVQKTEPGAEEKQEMSAVNNGEEGEMNMDPLVLEFLDAGTYEERLNILAALHHKITDDMINTMAVAVDVEVKEGDIEERYVELRNCLLTFNKFECNRLR